VQISIEKKANLPVVLKDTMSIYNKLKKDLKKNSTEEEKSLIMECVFKMTAIYVKWEAASYLSLADTSSKIEALEQCYLSYKEFESKL